MELKEEGWRWRERRGKKRGSKRRTLS